MEPGESFGERLDRWLARFGFKDDPFALFQADQEQPVLPFFFVDRPYLHRLVGDPNHPQPAFLLAGPGEGKTATREMVAYECVHGPKRRRALPVRYDDFGYALQQAGGDVSGLTARHHVHAVARLTLKVLADDVQVPQGYFDLIQGKDRSLLAAFIEAFADPISRLHLESIVGSGMVQVDWEALSARELLETLARLITRLGPSEDARYQALYILIDGVEESTASSEAAQALLDPLMSEAALLGTPRTAFKFFLPVPLGEHLRDNHLIRADRLLFERITWDYPSLQQVVEQRLRYFSDDRVLRLEDVCASSIKASVMDKLLHASDKSPRLLIRLCQALIHHRAQRGAAASLLADRDDLEHALAEVDADATRSTAQATSPHRLTRSAGPGDKASAATGLVLDENDHVWLDGEMLVPPLTDLELRLLQVLYRRAPEIVSHEMLIQEVWADSVNVEKHNLRKLVDRLRERLEPGLVLRSSSDSGSEDDAEPRFIHNARGRGYWLKLR